MQTEVNPQYSAYRFFSYFNLLETLLTLTYSFLYPKDHISLNLLFPLIPFP